MKKAVTLIAGISLLIGVTTANAQPIIYQNNFNYLANTSSEVSDNSQKLIDARKAYLYSLVENGYITQQQADADIEQYKARIEYRNSQYIDINNDTLVKAQKAYLDVLVNDGYLTQEQADSRISQYQSMLEYRQSIGYGNGYETYRGHGMHHHSWY